MFIIKEDSTTMSQAYADAHQRLVDAGMNTMVITADFAYGMGLLGFQKNNPSRFVNMGIAEQNMASFAAGLATEGIIPFIHCFGVFASRRMLDQAYISCAYAGLNVKIVGADPGYTCGHNGGTHMAMEDLAIMRTVPRALIVEPCDTTMLQGLMPLITRYDGFTYMRFFRGKTRKVYDDGQTFELGKSIMLRNGSDLTIITCGQCVADALIAADRLESEGIHARVLDMFTLKPLDVNAVKAASRETRLIVTVENAAAAGGLGGAVAETLCNGGHAPIIRMGRGDMFGEVATADELKALYHLTSEDIYTTALNEYRRVEYAQSL